MQGKLLPEDWNNKAGLSAPLCSLLWFPGRNPPLSLCRYKDGCIGEMQGPAGVPSPLYDNILAVKVSHFIFFLLEVWTVSSKSFTICGSFMGLVHHSTCVVWTQTITPSWYFKSRIHSQSWLYHLLNRPRHLTFFEKDFNNKIETVKELILALARQSNKFNNFGIL